MPFLLRAWMCWLVTVTVGQSLAVAAEAKLSPPQTVDVVRLVDAHGKIVELKPDGTALTVVCFLGTECPLARLYAPRLNQLAGDFKSIEVKFVGVDSNVQDSQADVTEYAREFNLMFPVYKDPDNHVADLFGADRISEVVVLDQTFTVRYRGRIDDQYQPGVMRSHATRDDLRLALEELVSRKRVSVARTTPAGCAIGRIPKTGKTTALTYCKDIARVLNQHCVECHRTGEIGPFSLTDYNEIRGWGTTLLESIDAGRMPPWNADPAHNHFRNARQMSTADREILRDWVTAGMPYGSAADLPPPQEYASGWQLPRSPDMVIKMRERPYHVPASGTVEYQYFVVDPHFTEDRWISAAQVIPGSRPTVHHCIVFVRPPDGADVRGVGYLTGYVPGQRSFSLPPGHARKVPAGSKLVFQMHYTPNGIEQDDLTQLGINWVPASEVTHEVFTLLGIDQEFEIPPQADNHPVQAAVRWFPKQAHLLAIVPHMHVRGKSFQAISRTGDQSRVLLEVPRYDFNWQHVYEFSEPMPLSQIDKLEFTARYDNSAKNPANPDPSQAVTWGDQTWEEMAIAFFEIAVPLQAPEEAEPPRNKQRLVLPSGAEAGPEVSAEKFVTDFFARFDRNRDGIVEKLETPLAFRQYGFQRYDANKDGRLSREEIQSAAERPRRQR